MGVGIEEIAAAAGGLALANKLPGMIVKPATPTAPLSTTQKLLQLAVGFGAAIAAGMAAKQILKGKAGEAAIAGGLAGTLVNALGNFTSYNLKQQPLMLPNPGGRIFTPHPGAVGRIEVAPEPAERRGL